LVWRHAKHGKHTTYAMNHCLITGGLGFIGSHLTDLMLRNGYKVTVVDNLQTGSLKNLTHLKSNPHVRVFIDNCAKTQVWEQFIKPGDWIFHLAGSVGVEKVTTEVRETSENNLNSTIAVIQAAKRTQAKLFIASTSEVYGDQGNQALTETDDLLINVNQKGRSAYTISKLYCELLGLQAAQYDGLHVVIGRLFNTTGPKQSSAYGMVVPKFAQQIIENQPISIFGTGEQRRSFCHVTDTCTAIYALSKTPQASGEIVNIGGIDDISINELAHFMAQLGNHSNLLTYLPYPEGRENGSDTMFRKPNVAKLKQLTGFEYKFTWKEAVQDVWADQIFQNSKRKKKIVLGKPQRGL
jgi:UDP-glucose 4-epimerase